MKKNRFIFTILFVLLAGSVVSFSYASDVSLNSSVTPEKGTVGQPLTYILSITGLDPSAVKIILPEKKIVYPDKADYKKDNKRNNKKSTDENEKSPGAYVPLYIINNASRNDEEVSGNKQITVRITISYYRTGTYTLPEIKVSGSDGIAIGYRIPAVTIDELNKEGNLEEIEPPVSLSGNYTRIIWIIAVLILIAAAAAALYFYFKKRGKPAVNIELYVPPIEIFLKEVELLKLRELIGSGKINEYVFDISIIFRRYLSATLKFDAAEMTTDEIAAAIKKYMPQEMYSVHGLEIISNMRLWDYSKFAEFTPSAELLFQNLDATISVAKKISENPEKVTVMENERGDNGTDRL